MCKIKETVRWTECIQINVDVKDCRKLRMHFPTNFGDLFPRTARRYLFCYVQENTRQLSCCFRKVLLGLRKVVQTHVESSLYHESRTTARLALGKIGCQENSLKKHQANRKIWANKKGLERAEIVWMRDTCSFWHTATSFLPSHTDSPLWKRNKRTSFNRN